MEDGCPFQAGAADQEGRGRQIGLSFLFLHTSEHAGTTRKSSHCNGRKTFNICKQTVAVNREDKSDNKAPWVISNSYQRRGPQMQTCSPKLERLKDISSSVTCLQRLRPRLRARLRLRLNFDPADCFEGRSLDTDTLLNLQILVCKL